MSIYKNSENLKQKCQKHYDTDVSINQEYMWFTLASKFSALYIMSAVFVEWHIKRAMSADLPLVTARDKVTASRRNMVLVHRLQVKDIHNIIVIVLVINEVICSMWPFCPSYLPYDPNLNSCCKRLHTSPVFIGLPPQFTKTVLVSSRDVSLMKFLKVQIIQQ